MQKPLANQCLVNRYDNTINDNKRLRKGLSVMAFLFRNGAKYLDRNPDTCFVAEKSDEIIGVIISGHDGRRGFIYHTAVKPEYRNQGIAKMLVKAAMDALKANGINKVALVVFDRNKDGNAFWEKVGFTVREDLVYRNKTISELIRIDT